MDLKAILRNAIGIKSRQTLFGVIHHNRIAKLCEFLISVTQPQKINST
jgi:hypothetical protein